jgi:hypothetical protein
MSSAKYCNASRLAAMRWFDLALRFIAGLQMW